MSKIKVMDEVLANKIAAGEVVEKTMNVVKELVENSIDAKSTEITIKLVDSGVKEIEVTDNGIGMDPEDACLAFSRHATSKLKNLDDLFYIESLGFRGEALPSIASVSNVKLKTSNGSIGTLITINGGKDLKEERCDLQSGTTITVSDLFYNTPVRLKYLKNLYTELAYIVEYINKMALSYPNIKFTLINNDKVLLATDGSGDLLKVIYKIYGADITKKMVNISGENDDYNISGYISYPEVSRSNRNSITTLVNGRVIKNNKLNKVIIDCYHTYIPKGKFPIIVLNIDVDPILIDINIHPTKMDIKFSKFDELNELIGDLIQKKLHELTLIPEIKEEVKYEKNDANYEEIVLSIDRLWSENKKEKLIDFSKKEAKSPRIKEKEIIHEEKKELPDLYPVGVVHGTYIICQNENGMYMIDQHAAKERINYEKFKYEMGRPSKDKIYPIFPYVFELSSNEAIIMKERMEILSNIGFDVEEIGINSIVIKAHPTWLIKGYEEDECRTIIEIILDTKDFSIEKFRENAAIMMSCKKAIKANEYISSEEIEKLLDDLRHCENPFNCPHGRPTIVYYSNYDLEKLFKRTGFES